MIYYAIKMIYYEIKWFTIQLFDFVNNLLVPVEGFNRYQISGKKKGAHGSRTRASAIRKLRVTTALHGAFDRFGGKSFKVQIFQQPKALVWNHPVPKVPQRYRVLIPPGTLGLQRGGSWKVPKALVSK